MEPATQNVDELPHRHVSRNKISGTNEQKQDRDSDCIRNEVGKKELRLINPHVIRRYQHN